MRKEKSNTRITAFIFFFVLVFAFVPSCKKKEEQKAENPASSDVFSDTSSDVVSDLPESSWKTESSELSEEELIEKILDSMSTEEKIGQLFIGRCPPRERMNDIGKFYLGGCTFYTTNFNHEDGSWLTKKELNKLLEDCGKDLTIKPFFGIDEEGGTVTRLSDNPDYFPNGRSQSPRRIIQKGGIEALVKDTTEKSLILRELGIHVNFAPVADIVTDKKAYMYKRSMGENASDVSEYVSVMVEAMKNAGIGSVLKHFPGHGNNEDTHYELAYDTKPYEEYINSDYLPFEAGIRAGCEAIMLSHIRVESIDPKNPASLSSKVVKELREVLRFDGVILTDDLFMIEVATEDYEGNTIVNAILAGNDMVITSDYKHAYTALEKALVNGDITEERMDESIRRILRFKIHLGIIN